MVVTLQYSRKKTLYNYLYRLQCVYAFIKDSTMPDHRRVTQKT
jgi:hypothetical protein